MLCCTSRPLAPPDVHRRCAQAQPGSCLLSASKCIPAGNRICCPRAACHALPCCWCSCRAACQQAGMLP
jgi:hypothetical protein